MTHWTNKKILISTLFVFSIFGAISWQWGNIADFTADNQFSATNHFGLTMTDSSGKLLVNQFVVGSPVWSIVFALLILIWKRMKENVKFQILLTLLVFIVALGFLRIIPRNPIYWLMIHTPIFPPVAWVSFVFSCLWLIFSERLSDKLSLWVIVISFFLLGDLVHGWFNHFTSNALLGVLSFTLYTLTMFSYIAWLTTLLIPIAIVMGLVIALAIAMSLLSVLIGIGLIALIILIVIGLIALIISMSLLGVLIGIGLISLIILMVIGLISLIISMARGITPREYHRASEEFLTCLCGNNDPGW